MEELAAALKATGRWSGDWLTRRKNGEVFVSSWEVSTLATQGQSRWIYVQRDVTNERLSREALAESEARKAAILNAALDAIISSDDLGNVTEFNPAAEKMFGYRRSEIIGKEMSTFIIPAHLRQRHKEGMRRYLETGDGPVLDRRIEMPALRSSGETFPIEMAISRISLPGKTHFTAYLRDISERKRVEAEAADMQNRLREERERLQLAHDAAGIATFDRNIETEQVVFSSNYWPLYGFDQAPAKPTFESWLTLLHPEDRSPVADLWAQAFRDGKAQIASEFRVVWPDGTIHWLQGRARLFFSGGSPTRVIGTNLDITDQKRREEQLARQSREMEEFAYVASHDLKEPLRKVGSFADLLSQAAARGDKQKAEEFAGKVSGSIERARALIDDLLTYSAVDRVELVKRPVDLSIIVRHVAEEAELAAPQGSSIVVGSLPIVAAVETQMRQLFQNLLQNAVKYRSERPLKVRVSCEDDGSGSWRFAVADNGIGIAPHYRRDVFKMFTRLHGREKYPGTGIGLSVCQKIIERHGGEIWIGDGIEGGTAFHFRLPKGRLPVVSAG